MCTFSSVLSRGFRRWGFCSSNAALRTQTVGEQEQVFGRSGDGSHVANRLVNLHATVNQQLGRKRRECWRYRSWSKSGGASFDAVGYGMFAEGNSSMVITFLQYVCGSHFVFLPAL